MIFEFSVTERVKLRCMCLTSFYAGNAVASIMVACTSTLYGLEPPGLLLTASIGACVNTQA